MSLSVTLSLSMESCLTTRFSTRRDYDNTTSRMAEQICKVEHSFDIRNLFRTLLGKVNNLRHLPSFAITEGQYIPILVT